MNPATQLQIKAFGPLMNLLLSTILSLFFHGLSACNSSVKQNPSNTNKTVATNYIASDSVLRDSFTNEKRECKRSMVNLKIKLSYDSLVFDIFAFNKHLTVAIKNCNGKLTLGDKSELNNVSNVISYLDDDITTDSIVYVAGKAILYPVEYSWNFPQQSETYWYLLPIDSITMSNKDTVFWHEPAMKSQGLTILSKKSNAVVSITKHIRQYPSIIDDHYYFNSKFSFFDLNAWVDLNSHYPRSTSIEPELVELATMKNYDPSPEICQSPKKYRDYLLGCLKPFFDDKFYHYYF